MKRISMLMGLMFLMAGIPAYGATTVKIGLIDSQKIMRDSQAAKEAREMILEDLKGKRALFSEKQEKLKKAEEDLKKDAAGLKPESLEQKKEELARDAKALQRLKDDFEEELNKKNVDLTQRILREVFEIVKAFTKDEKYTLILETKSVVSSDEAIDVTDQIIKLYDKKMKK